MIITSSQQIEDMMNPLEATDLNEFEDIALKFGAFVCIARNKKLNYLNFLKFLIEDKKTQKIFFELLGDYNLQNIIKTYLSLTPNIYKKIFRFKQNRQPNDRNSKTNIQQLPETLAARTAVETS